MERRPTRLTSETELPTRLARMREERSQVFEAEKTRRAIHDSVAMLHVFDPFDVPSTLEPPEVISVLGADVEPSADDDGNPRWSLRLPHREAALLRLGGPAEILARARSSPARIATRIQLLFESWLEGSAPTIPDDEEELAELRLVAAWIEKVRGVLPPATIVLGQMQLKRLRRRLDTAVGPSFRGRRHELDTLRDENGGPRTIVIEARGGMGKSALLAKLLLELGAFEQGAPILAAHLDLDDPNLDVGAPASLLEAIAVQLDAQVEQSLREFKEQAQAARRSSEGNEGPSKDRFLALQLRKRLEGWFPSCERVVIVVDTLERALNKSPELTRAALRVLRTLLAGIPSTLVLAGRGPIPERLFLEDEVLSEAPRNETRLLLDELDGDAAIGVLLSLGVPTERFARALAEKFGRSPLTLRLLARVVLQGGFREADLASKELGEAVDKALVLGFLYRRILAHVLDPRVRRIAHPGFALRAITPELVGHVLGWAPHPPVRDLNDAKVLHEKLRAVHDLVTVDADGSTLRLRPEVRTEVLRLMRNDPAAQSDLVRVHRAALAWFDEKGALADAVYHLLHLGRLDHAAERWSPEIGRALADAKEDFDTRARVWLEERLADESHQSHARNAELRAWEEEAIRRVDALLTRQRTEEALRVLRERTERTGESARLALMEARTYLQLEQPEDAYRAALDAAPMAERADDARALAEAHAQLARLGRALKGDVAQSLADWARAIEQARRTTDRMFLLALTFAARADIATIVPPPAELEMVTRDVRETFFAASLAELGQDPPLIRAIAAQMTELDILRRALAANVIRYPMALNAEQLANALEALGEETESTRELLSSLSADGSQSWRSLLRGAARLDALTRALETILDRHPTKEVLLAVSFLFFQSLQLADHERLQDRSAALARLTKIVADDVAADDWIAIVRQLHPTLARRVESMTGRNVDVGVGIDAAELAVVQFQRAGLLNEAVRELRSVTPPGLALELAELEKVLGP